jgi:hypothetical protein
LGLAESGKNRQDLRERFKRLSGLTVGITRKNGDNSLLMPLIEEKRLPSSVDLKKNKAEYQLTAPEKSRFWFQIE